MIASTSSSMQRIIQCVCRSAGLLAVENGSCSSKFTKSSTIRTFTSTSRSAMADSSNRARSLQSYQPYRPPELPSATMPQHKDRSPLLRGLEKKGRDHQSRASAEQEQPVVTNAMFGTSKRADSRNAKEGGVLYREAAADKQFQLPQSLPTGRSQPVSPSDSRSVPVQIGQEFGRQYKRLMNGCIAINDVRNELRLQERYEKPKYHRQRLASARHRRRFANEVGIRVAAVLRARRQGM